MSTKSNSKKRLQDEDTVDSITNKVSKKEKKDKKKIKKDKSKKKNKESPEEKQIIEVAVSEKKKKKKSKKTEGSVPEITKELAKEDISTPKKKKSKKAKSSKETVEEKKESISKTEEPSVSNNAGWIDWSKTSFEDQTRKDKFLRLMGAKKQDNNSNQPQAAPKKGLFGSLTSSSFKPSVPASSLGSASLSAESQKKISADLENQFEAAQRMKKNLQRGVKRGIGA